MASVIRQVVLTPSIHGADGVSEVSRQIVRALEENGDPVTVHALDSHARRRGFIAGALAESASASPATTVYVSHLHLAPAAMPMVWRGARMVIVLHGIEAWTAVSGMRRRALLNADRLIAVSHYTAGRFRAANPELAHLPVHVCHPACPSPAVPGNQMFPPGFALIVGRMAAAERYKGHDVLIDSWSSIREAVPGARLVIAGDGDDRPRLERKAAEARLGDAIAFTGNVSPQQLAGLYRDAAFFAMPSVGEGFGLVYLEAMRAGLPCIASPGAAAEIVESGRTGLVVPPDVLAISRAAVGMFLDTEQRQRYGEAAAAACASRFEFSRFQERFAAAVEAEALC